MQTARCIARTSSIWLALLAGLAGCRSTGGETRWSRHFQTDVWAGGLAQNFEKPQQFGPEAMLLVATPLFYYAFDDDISEDALHEYITHGNTSTGDYLALSLGATALVTGGVEALNGDGGHSAEVAVETLVVDEIATEALKRLTHRHRPEGNSNDSFPSGHTSFSFAAATFMARRIDDWSDSDYDKIGYLLYLPAAYVGATRLEGQRHFLSDITFGAFLGIFTANWIYNAHYGQPEANRPGIFTHETHAAWSVGPAVLDQGLGLQVQFSF